MVFWVSLRIALTAIIFLTLQWGVNQLPEINPEKQELGPPLAFLALFTGTIAAVVAIWSY